VVRTYISLPAGIAEMNLTQFVAFTFLGSLLWTVALAWLGMWLGEQGQISDPTMLPDRLGGVFHELDVVIVVALVVAVASNVYHHRKPDRQGREREGRERETTRKR
jgi:membrane protein DedA with SNARE-associated domain